MKLCLIVYCPAIVKSYAIDGLVDNLQNIGIVCLLLETMQIAPDFRIYNLDKLSDSDIDGILALIPTVVQK